MSASYRFIPWVRQGASAAVRTVDTLGAGLPARPSLPVTLTVNGRDAVSTELRIHGPGDAVGFDERTVVRTDPPLLSAEFEPNYFPSVEMAVPVLPWLLTPATGDDSGRLRPWLTLVVVRRQPGVSLRHDGDRPLPVLTISPPANPRDELSDLEESWAWAHTQVTSSEAGGVRRLIARGTGVVSRLLCPRRLRPVTSYLACVVPAFAAGRQAGLGEFVDPAAETELTPAWSLDELADTMELPVYFHWEFATGVGGDFESLVRRLRARAVPEGVGTRSVRIGDAGVDLPDGGLLPMQGALRAPEAEADPGVPAGFSEALINLLNLPDEMREGGAIEDPIVAPPIYGSWQALQRRIGYGTPVWVRDLNRDPRFRAAAGLGTVVVQDQQDELMSSAWAQLGKATHATDQTRRRELGRAVLRRVHGALQPLSPEALLRVTGPLLARVRLDAPEPAPGEPAEIGPRTVRETILASSVPLAVVSSPFRRVTRPLGPALRKLHSTGGATASPSHPPLFVSGLEALFARPAAVIHALVPGSAVTAAAIETRVNELPVLSTHIEEGFRFREAATAMSDYLAQLTGGGTAPVRPPLALAEIKVAMLAKLDPGRTLPPAVEPPPPPTPADEPEAPGIPEPVITSSLPGPTFPQPMYEFLRELAPELLLPGMDLIPPDSVTLLETNPAFIESFMVGLNHEMSRELLWREYPSELRSTPFRRFWGGSLVMPELHEWSAEGPLGTQLDAGSNDQQLVMLIRGELLHRYPRTVIYASPAIDPVTPGPEKRYPIFRAALGPDMTFLGFDLSAEEVRGGQDEVGWFFVIEQPPGEPRFGLDASTSTGRDPDALASWNQLSWGDVAEDDEALAALTHAPLSGRLSNHRIGALAWGMNSGHMAAITLQRPVRVLLHAAELLTPEPEDADA